MLAGYPTISDASSRSREGAWIEILITSPIGLSSICRSREGAWIEIIILRRFSKWLEVAPARERGLKCRLNTTVTVKQKVAPARERGLKYYLAINYMP